MLNFHFNVTIVKTYLQTNLLDAADKDVKVIFDERANENDHDHD